MKNTILKLLLLSIATFLLALVSWAKDPIEGKWWNEEKTAQVEIYLAKNGKYYGKIIWLKKEEDTGKPVLDEHNPNKAERSKPLKGLLMLKGFKKASSTTYEDGTIYDPRNGKTYSCKITYKDEKTLAIRGYVGVSLLGRTNTWTRVE